MMHNRFVIFILRLTGTVIARVWWQVLLMAMYTSLIVYLYDYYNLNEKDDVPHNLSTFQVLGIVTGLLLVFRTNTAYDRYWEGRKLWSEMVHNIRIITRTIWVMVDDKKDSKILVGKISLLNLLVGFAYATKHYLREEYSRKEDDLKDLVNHLPQLLTPSSNEPLDRQEKSMGPTEEELKKMRSRMAKETEEKMQDQNEKEGERRKFSSLEYALTPELQRAPVVITSNIPLEISYFISSYIVSCKDRNLIDSPTCRVLDTAVANMVRCLTGFERIRRTPIPFAYSIHLTQITWIVLLMLPFQWVVDLKWYTIPATTIAAFSLLGILAIGRELENPFGYDYNDLNLDDFCRVLHKEVVSLIAHPMPNPDTWLFGESNKPIITDPTLSAATLVKLKYSEIQQVLSEGKDYRFFHPSKSECAYSMNSKSGTSQKVDKTSLVDHKV